MLSIDHVLLLPSCSLSPRHPVTPSPRHLREVCGMIQASRPVLVVAGTGMAGAKVVEEVLAREPDRFSVRMFGAEPHGTYNRILLSSVLGGFVEPSKLWLNPLDWY